MTASARQSCALQVTPSEVIGALERAGLIVEFLAERATKRGDVAGGDAWRLVVEKVDDCIASVRAAKNKQSSAREAAQEVLF